MRNADQDAWSGATYHHRPSGSVTPRWPQRSARSALHHEASASRRLSYFRREIIELPRRARRHSFARADGLANIFFQLATITPSCHHFGRIGREPASTTRVSDDWPFSAFLDEPAQYSYSIIIAEAGIGHAYRQKVALALFTRRCSISAHHSAMSIPYNNTQVPLYAKVTLVIADISGAVRRARWRPINCRVAFCCWRATYYHFARSEGNVGHHDAAASCRQLVYALVSLPSRATIAI